MNRKITIALAGNPNSGKTTIFNELTGSRQHVGNYPGVTVEKKEGTFWLGRTEIDIVDLPGTYSLTASSPEEVVARDFILNEKPDVVVDILDASNLERNLYLATQLMEMQVPTVLAFNMSDVAKSRGMEFDLDHFSKLLNVSIVPTIGHRGKGLKRLMQTAVEAAGLNGEHRPVQVKYDEAIETEVALIQESIERFDGKISNHYDSRWLALKLLERDKDVRSKINVDELLSMADRSIARLKPILDDEVSYAITEQRYRIISDFCSKAVKSTVLSSTLSDKIDAVVTNRFLALPLFMAMMYLVFHLTFTLGDPMMGWVENAFGWLGEVISGFWPAGSESMLKSLLVDGVIGGVGGVLVFLPNILLLFLAIAFLEDSGYMARVAFIMDRLMQKIGLHGKSFIPMLIGFGCTVPAIMATRTLDDRRDRLTTMMVLPLMSCGARLPIYTLIIPAFFPKVWHAPIMWIIYLIGILLAIICAKLLKVTVLKGENMPFVMELPPYRIPTIRSVGIHMWQRAWLYLKKAGTLILAISVIMWVLTVYPKPAESDLRGLDANQAQQVELSQSMAGRIGHAMEPVLRPMGFDWRIGTSLIGAFAAKEVFVAQLGIIYSVGEADEESASLRDKLSERYSPLVGFCIMLFCLISAPCMATIAVTRRESGSWKWALFQLGGLTALAWIVTTLVYQIGSLVG